MAPSPVVARWELSRRLATRRKELGIDVKSVTDALGFTRNYWSAVENDRTLIAEDKLRLLFDLFDFADRDQSELLQLREDSRKRGWWDEYPSLTADHKRFYGMEAGAVRIRAYTSQIMPGALQIEPYSRAVLATDPGFSPVEVDQMSAVRNRRQQELFSSDQREFDLLVSEAVLRQQVDGEATQLEQLRSVHTALVGENRISIRVLPFEVNPGAILSSANVLFLEYASQHLPATAWQEGVQLLGYVEADEESFQRLDFAWAQAMGRALDAGSSGELIEGLMEDLQRKV